MDKIVNKKHMSEEFGKANIATRRLFAKVAIRPPAWGRDRGGPFHLVCQLKDKCRCLRAQLRIAVGEGRDQTTCDEVPFGVT